MSNEEIPIDPPVKREYSTWLPMHFDMRLNLDGLDWYRVKGGFGGHDDREDWVCGLPKDAVSASVSKFRMGVGQGWGWDGDETREQAMRHSIEGAIESSHTQIAEAEATIAALRAGLSRLTTARDSDGASG